MDIKKILGWKEIQARIAEDANNSIAFAMINGTVITQDEDCVEEAICHHIVEASDDPDDSSPRCMLCGHTFTLEELEDEEVRDSDNRSYAEAIGSR